METTTFEPVRRFFGVEDIYKSYIDASYSTSSETIYFYLDTYENKITARAFRASLWHYQPGVRLFASCLNHRLTGIPQDRLIARILAALERHFEFYKDVVSVSLWDNSDDPAQYKESGDAIMLQTPVAFFGPEDY